MKVLEEHESNKINDDVEDNIDQDAMVFTKKATSYLDIKNYNVRDNDCEYCLY